MSRRRGLGGPDHLPGRDRVTELLGWLQVGTCTECGRSRYFSRREARYAVRLASPGVRLRAYRCGGFWHLAPPSDDRKYGTIPTAAEPPQTPRRSGLDLLARVERAYGGRRYPGGHHARPGDRRWSDAISLPGEW
jgi:hypothetical protein